jgi:acyl carrier protein
MNIAGLIADELKQIQRERGAQPRDLGAGTSLVEDLGFDSITFIDLTLRLEARLGLREFPLQDWVDEESMKAGQARHTLASLTAYAESVVAQAKERHPSL